MPPSRQMFPRLSRFHPKFSAPPYSFLRFIHFRLGSDAGSDSSHLLPLFITISTNFSLICLPPPFCCCDLRHNSSPYLCLFYSLNVTLEMTHHIFVPLSSRNIPFFTTFPPHVPCFHVIIPSFYFNVTLKTIHVLSPPLLITSVLPC